MRDLLSTYLFRVILIPSGVFISVMFGGGASSGREIAQYMTINGPFAAYIAISLVAFIYGTVVFFCYELARLYRAYDYQAFSKVILGQKAWVLYEVCLTASMFMVLAYAATAGGTALADHFELPRYYVTALLLAAIVFLNYQGRRLVELSQVGTAAALLLCCLAIFVAALSQHSGTIAANLENTQLNLGSLLSNVWTYSVVVMAYVPIILYASRDLKSRSETLVAGYASGFTITLPFFGLHTAFLSQYPEILDKPIPNGWIAAEVLPPLFSDIFIIVLFLVILQTGVGLLQGFLERLDAWAVSHRQKPLNKKTHGLISAGSLVTCLAISGIGVIALLNKIYAITYWLFMPVFILPLFTVGAYKIFKHRLPYSGIDTQEKATA